MNKKPYIDYFLAIDDIDKREDEFARFCAFMFKDKKAFDEKEFNHFCDLYPQEFIGIRYEKQLKKSIKERLKAACETTSS